MTRLLPPEVIACPACDALALRPCVASFNSFGVTRWTDGYQDRLVNFLAPRLAKCLHCAHPFWPEDARTVGRLPPGVPRMGALRRLWLRLTGDRAGHVAARRAHATLPPDWRSAKALLHPRAGDWQTILADAASLTAERELIARRHLWWLHNDPFRGIDTAEDRAHAQTLDKAVEREANLVRMRTLLESATPGDDQRLELGEVLRQLGAFEQACEVFMQVTGALRDEACALADLAQACDPYVRMIGHDNVGSWPLRTN